VRLSPSESSHFTRLIGYFHFDTRNCCSRFNKSDSWLVKV
jgi:hypothetical protein